MARIPRSAATSTWHHVMNRGARRLSIFGDDTDRESFLTRLDEAHETHGIEIHAYALLTNHFHLLLHAPVETISRSMQLIAGRHAQRHNAKYGLDGPLFRGRYRSKPIETQTHLRRAVRYIHRNPIAHAPAAAPTADSLRWTSHGAYAGTETCPEWLSVEPIRQSQFAGSVLDYRRFVLGAAEAPYEPPAEQWAGPPRAFRMSDIETAIGAESEPERELLRVGGRGVRNNARLACVLLAHEYVTNRIDVIAQRYGFASGSTVRSALSRARGLTDSDPEFAATIERARLHLHAIAHAA